MPTSSQIAKQPHIVKLSYESTSYMWQFVHNSNMWFVIYIGLNYYLILTEIWSTLCHILRNIYCKKKANYVTIFEVWQNWLFTFCTNSFWVFNWHKNSIEHCWTGIFLGSSLVIMQIVSQQRFVNFQCMWRNWSIISKINILITAKIIFLCTEM